jgi:hypothetical protein
LAQWREDGRLYRDRSRHRAERQIAVQIHGGAKAEASYKDIVIEELPVN